MNDNTMLVKMVFKHHGWTAVDERLFGWLKPLMKREFIRVYNIYAAAANGGVLDSINESFKAQYPDYKHPENWEEDMFYNKYVADSCNRMICNNLNGLVGESLLLKFEVHSNLQFVGRLKFNPKLWVEIYIKEIY